MLGEEDLTTKVIEDVNEGEIAFCKFLSANETGETGGHQFGILINSQAYRILFNDPGTSGIIDRYVKIKWQNDFITDSRFVYYSSKKEYRITRFGRKFPFLQPECTGDLFILIRFTAYDYSGYFLKTDEDIDKFLDVFGMSPVDTGTIIQKDDLKLGHMINSEELSFMAYIESLGVDFPSSNELSRVARTIYYETFDHKENIILAPDKEIISWVNAEYHLFRLLESYNYGTKISHGFESVEEFIKFANVVLNRRKSRAGKSLEHHLSAIFDGNSLKYTAQPKTEGNKKPDFLFPDSKSYHNNSFPDNNLIFLGAKTTCKDRWRQILNEADRIKVKHLFTLQQGVSVQQLEEMEKSKVVLVVPEEYISTYPKEKQSSIWTLKKFIEYVEEKDGI